MTKTKATAPAGKTAAPKASPITGGRIVPKVKGNLTVPTLVFKGDAPKVGSKITAKMKNGSKYTGTVSDVTEADGEIIAEFSGGLIPS